MRKKLIRALLLPSSAWSNTRPSGLHVARGRTAAGTDGFIGVIGLREPRIIRDYVDRTPNMTCATDEETRRFSANRLFFAQRPSSFQHGDWIVVRFGAEASSWDRYAIECESLICANAGIPSAPLASSCR